MSDVIVTVEPSIQTVLVDSHPVVVSGERQIEVVSVGTQGPPGMGVTGDALPGAIIYFDGSHAVGIPDDGASGLPQLRWDATNGFGIFSSVNGVYYNLQAGDGSINCVDDSNALVDLFARGIYGNNGQFAPSSDITALVVTGFAGGNSDITQFIGNQFTTYIDSNGQINTSRMGFNSYNIAVATSGNGTNALNSISGQGTTGGYTTSSVGAYAGNGGGIYYTSGAGGVSSYATSGFPVGGQSGVITFLTGNAGNGTSSTSGVLAQGGTAGGINLIGGYGGQGINVTGTSNARGGSGTPITIQAGGGGYASASGTATGGNGGSIFLTAGLAGLCANGASNIAGAAGNMTLKGGSAATATGITSTQTGGSVTLQGGNGASAAATCPSSVGGKATVQGGTGGGTNSAVSVGGDAELNGGTGGTGAFGDGVGGVAYVRGGKSGGAGAGGGAIILQVAATTSWATAGNIQNTGRWKIGDSSAATAKLHITAGTSGSSGAPLKFTSGTNTTTAEAGAMEYNGTNLFFTRTGTTREGVLVGNRGASAPSTTTAGTITNRYGGGTNFLGDPVTWFSVVGDNGTTYKIPAYT